DVTDAGSIERMVTSAAGSFKGAIDILVYVAGGVRGQSAKPVEGVSLEDWRAIVDTNLTGAFLFAKAVAPGMKRGGCGRIVTIPSRAARAPTLTGLQRYPAAKHGPLGLVRQHAPERGPSGGKV